MCIVTSIVLGVQDLELIEPEISKVTFLFTLLDLALEVEIRGSITVATLLDLLEKNLKVASRNKLLLIDLKIHPAPKITRQRMTEVKADRLQQKAEVGSESSLMIKLSNHLKVHVCIHPPEEKEAYKEKTTR